MNTVQKGDVLEAAIYDLIKAEIEDGKFLFRSECCQVFRRKGYHSRDRKSKIVFDVSVEVFLPRSKRHSLLVLIECKNLGRAVTVDEVEEFFTKSQQVGAANSKAIMVSSSGFQRGGYNFAKSKGVGLARYFEPSNLKWELRRSASASYLGNGGSEEIDFEEALTQEDYRSSLFDLYCQNGRKGTVSLWEFLDSIAQESTLSPAAYRSVRNPKGGASSSVPFIEKSELEVISAINTRTSTSQRLVTSGFHEITRANSPDDEFFRTMFFPKLHAYQWLPRKLPDTHETRLLFHQLTAGIPRIGVALWIHANQHAIERRAEGLEDQDLRHAASHALAPLQAAVQALNSGDPRRMLQYEDLLPRASA